MRSLLIILHVVLALAVLVVLCRQLGQRLQEVAALRVQAQIDREETARMEREMELQRNLLGGLRASHPFVVELLARERLGYQRPGEYRGPPAVDKPAKPR